MWTMKRFLLFIASVANWMRGSTHIFGTDQSCRMVLPVAKLGLACKATYGIHRQHTITITYQGNKQHMDAPFNLLTNETMGKNSLTGAYNNKEFKNTDDRSNKKWNNGL